MAENVERAPIVEESQQDPTNEIVSQAMLRVLEQMTGSQIGTNNRGTIAERLRAKAEMF